MHRIVILFTIAAFRIFSAIPDTLELPPGLAIPNYNRIQIGQIEASEGGAAVARASGITANWYNPAGLGLTQRFALNASYSGYEIAILSLDNLEEPSQLLEINGTPGFFGFVIRLPFKGWERYRLGISLCQPSSWSPGLVTSSISDTGGTTIRTSVLYELDYNTYYPTIAIGALVNGRFRYGFGINIPYTSFNIDQSIVIHQLEPSVLNNQIITFEGNGSTGHLVFTAGLQYEISDKIITGLMIKTPGIRLWKIASIFYETLMSQEDSSTSMSFRDEDVSFNYRFPFQINIGTAYQKTKWSIEIDLNYYMGTGKYTLLESDQNALVLESRFGATTQRRSIPFPEIVYDNRSVFNVSIGGNYHITEKFWIQAGGFTDFSPVDQEQSTVFRSINLFGTTLGVSYVSNNFTGAVGIRFNFGSSKNFSIIEASPIDTKVNLRSLALNWAVTFGG